MRWKSRVAAVGVATVAAWGLSACAGESTTTADTTNITSSANATKAEIEFAQMMIPHHEQALEMAQMALDPATGASPEVQQLATQIAAAQAPEIAQMQGWLQEWGADEADPHGSHGAAHSMAAGTDEAMGMLSDEQMAALADARGSQFDQLWLEGMIAHHEGAVDMAEQVKTQSTNPDVLALADDIIASQLAEIDQMQGLLSD